VISVYTIDIVVLPFALLAYTTNILTAEVNGKEKVKNQAVNAVLLLRTMRLDILVFFAPSVNNAHNDKGGYAYDHKND